MGIYDYWFDGDWLGFSLHGSLFNALTFAPFAPSLLLLLLCNLILAELGEDLVVFILIEELDAGIVLIDFQ